MDKRINRICLQALVFTLTYWNYALNHAGRKAFSTAKYSIHHDFRFGQLFLSSLDTVFMGAYAIGVAFTGHLGDRFGMNNVVTVGSLLSGFFLCAFGVSSLVPSFQNEGYFVVSMTFLALAQSVGLPICISIMGQWFKSKGSVYGLWTSNGSVGNILGLVIAAYVLAVAPWPYVYYTLGGLNICAGIWMVGFLPSSNSNKPQSFKSAVPINENEPLSFFQALMLPGVLIYSISFGCTKLVHYSFFSWLPFYLTSNLDFDAKNAAFLSSWYDFGGAIGGFLAGSFSDFLLRKFKVDRSCFLSLLLLLSTGQLYLYYTYAPVSQEMNVFLMIVVGFFIGGPNNLIPAVVSIDLNEQPTLKGNQESIAMVTSILLAISSWIASLGQLVVGAISAFCGWEMTFFFFMSISAFSGLLLLILVYRSSKGRIEILQQQDFEEVGEAVAELT